MKDKILNFLLIFLTLFLILSIFSEKPEEKKLDWKILFSSVSSSYAVPASPELRIQNNSSEKLVVDTCEDIKVKYDWEILNFNDSFCEKLELNTWEVKVLKYEPEYDKFNEKWIYHYFIKLDWKEYISNFEIEYMGAFSQLFTTLFYAPLYNLMAFLIEVTWYSLWWAIIIITIIIRIALLWPQHKMMVSQRKMQAIQPKIKEVQEKYKWNNQMLWIELMKLYKEEKVNPMWSCGMLLIQMPILIVVYHIIISIQDVSNSYYLYSSLQGFNTSLISANFYWLDLLAIWWLAWLVLALLVWFVQFIQVKLSLSFNENKDSKWVVLEKKKGSNDYNSMMPDPEFMNKFMLYWMPIMVAIFTYSFFAWVGIYWWISTLFMIFQQLIVNKIIK